MNGGLFEAAEPELWRLVLGPAEPGGPIIRKAAATYCPKCKAAVIQALDDDMCALPILADPVALSAVGELTATLTGRRTVELRRTAGGFHLDGRNHDMVSGRPAGSGRVDVLGEHRCGLPLATDPAGPLLRTPVPLPANTEPPF